MTALDTAQRPGGLYYTADGTAVDAEGNLVEGAPKRGKDTAASEQPGYTGPGATPLAGAFPAGGIMVTPELLASMVQAEVAKSHGAKAASHPKGGK